MSASDDTYSESDYDESELSDSEGEPLLPFLKFPREVHFIIATHLEPDTLAALALTNRYLSSIYQTDLSNRSLAQWNLRKVYRKKLFPEYLGRIKVAIEKDASRDEYETLMDEGRNFGSRRLKAELPRLLVYAIRYLRRNAVRAILDRGVDVNIPVHGYHPIHYASRIPALNLPSGKKRYNLEDKAGDATPDQFTILRWLLDHGAKVNSLTTQGESPLMKAAECAQTDIVKFLVSRGAWANLCTKKGTTALSLACRRTFRPMVRRPGFQVLVREDLRYKTVEYLLSLKVPISLPSGSQTALHSATRAQHHRIVELLLDVGADVNAIDKLHGNTTPLIEAVRNGNETSVMMFLRYACGKIDFEIKDSEGKTALDYAMQTNNRTVESMLRDFKTRKTPEKVVRSPQRRLEKKASSGSMKMRTPPRLFFGSG